MLTFKVLKKRFKTAFIEILRRQQNLEIYEAAVPAYAHKNPFIDLIFWKRLQACYNLMNNDLNVKVLDFGCGTGVMSYFLAHNGFDVTATDLSLEPQKLIENEIKFPKGIKFIEGDILRDPIRKNFEKESFDYILALDSLEHIEDITEYILFFKLLLKPDGKIIVSGPTENIYYKIGRKLAGKKFNGEYHVSDIRKIYKHFSFQFKVKIKRRLFYPVVLFEIFTAENDISPAN